MSLFHDLVAGQVEPGYREGRALDAKFNHPQGLAISPDGTRLYVADRTNDRIRVVSLDREDDVRTLAGGGDGDGPFERAGFTQPRSLAVLPNDRLAVAEHEGIRLLDLVARRVTTLRPRWRLTPDEVHGLFGFAAGPDGSLYLSFPEIGDLFRVSVPSGIAEEIVHRDPNLSRPGALCFHEGRLTVADQASGRILQEGGEKGQWVQVGSAADVRALAADGSRLYALTMGPKPFVCLSPAGDATPISVWGHVLRNDSVEPLPGLVTEALEPAGLVFDPREERRALISASFRNMIVSLRDYGQSRGLDAWSIQEGGLRDFAYPRRKPPRTFRVLVAGDSRAFTTTPLDEKRSGGYSNRMETFPKRLELFLNMEAALSRGAFNYQVLSFGEVVHDPLYVWVGEDLPPAASAYDVDLVLVALGPASASVNVWYDRPLAADGLPSRVDDGEYLLRPARERIQPGLPARFFERCAALGLARIDPSGARVQFSIVENIASHPELEGDLVEMLGRPLERLRKRLGEPGQKPRRLVLVYLPFAMLRFEDVQRRLWREVSAKYHIDFLDLGDAVGALRMSLYPLSEIRDNDHISADGSVVLGWLLSRELIRTGRIPP